MKYLITTDKKTAVDRSAQIATALGCGKQKEDITRYWFSVIEHPTSKAGAIAVPDVAEENKLAGSEKTALKPESELIAGGWFPKDAVDDGKGVKTATRRKG